MTMLVHIGLDCGFYFAHSVFSQIDVGLCDVGADETGEKGEHDADYGNHYG